LLLLGLASNTLLQQSADSLAGRAAERGRDREVPGPGGLRAVPVAGALDRLRTL